MIMHKNKDGKYESRFKFYWFSNQANLKTLYTKKVQ